MEGKTGYDLGFYMPAEWEEHEGTWLQWPHNDTHEGLQMRLEHIWLAMVGPLHQHEVVCIATPDQRRLEQLQRTFAFYGFDERQIDLHVIPTDDVWARDNGPIFLMNDRGELAISQWNFNGWGERYPWEKDCLVPAKAAEALAVPLFTAPIVLEGGAIEVNGQGTLIATRTSILNPNRNPGKSQAEIEKALGEYLGVKHTIWLSGAPREFCDAVGDETDFHIDCFARFVDESTVLYTWTDDETHPFYPYLCKHKEELQNARMEAGIALTLAPLLLPENRMYSTINTSTRPPFAPRSSLALYTNFYVANQVVLVPVYGDINDPIAKGIIADHFPNREIIGIPAQTLAELGGMMHCVTQQQPKPRTS